MANMAGIEQRDNIAIATPERAFLDMVYLSAGQCYFDNLRPLNQKDEIDFSSKNAVFSQLWVKKSLNLLHKRKKSYIFAPDIRNGIY